MRKKLLTLILSVGATASATPLSFDLLGGGEIDSRDQSYSYLGLVISGSVDGGNRVLLRLWTDYLKRSGRRLLLSILRTWSFSLWSGWERRNTRVRPDVPGVEVKGVTDSLILQFEAYGSFGSGTNVSFITSYSSGTSYLWSRARGKKRISGGGFSLGWEVLGHGNEDYRAFQSGPLVEIPVAGLCFYGGIELYSGF